MINILVHGLGQDEKSWNEVKNQLNNNGINVEIPNLFSIVKNYQVNYENMYETFADYCNSFNEKINLVGLSLGGVLALDFVKKYPEKVNSIILIGTPYKITKALFKMQSLIFHIMPKSTFEKMGCCKTEFITLVNSMSNLNIAKDLETIKCKSLIACGAKDNVNMESAKLLNNSIKNSEFKVISNLSHEVNIDNPKELSNIIYDFWKDNQ